MSNIRIPNPKNQRFNPKNIGVALLVFAILVSIISLYSTPAEKIPTVPLSKVATEVDEGKVERLVVEEENITVELKEGEKQKAIRENDAALSESLRNFGVPPEKLRGVEIAVKEPSGFGFWAVTILPVLLPFLLLGAFMLFMIRSAQSANSRAMSFGQTKSKPQGETVPKKKVTFKDVAGAESAKEELVEVVDFLRHSKKYTKMGARIPKGILLVGAPGTGKTLLAKAVAGEADVPFFHMSGSEFVEMFVGVGASVTGDTPVLAKTPEGIKLLPIKDVVDRHYKEGQEGFPIRTKNLQTLGFREKSSKFSGSPKKFFGESAWSNVSAVYRHKVKNICEIRYLGGTLKTTEDHSVFVRTRDGVQPKAARDLRAGDVLVQLPMRVRGQYDAETGTPHDTRAHHFLKTAPQITLRVADDNSATEACYQYAKAQTGAMAQHQIAERIGVSQMTVSNWQRERYRPRALAVLKTQTKIPAAVTVTPPLLKLFGYYTAEGRENGSLQFCFGAHETSLHADVTRMMRGIFGIEPARERTADNTLRLTYYSAPLGRFFARHCGNGSHNKRIPEFLWNMPREYFLAFLEGYALGDGYHTAEGKLSMTSVSRQLIRELTWLSAMHGIPAGARRISLPRGRIIKSKPLPKCEAWNLIIGKTGNPFQKRAPQVPQGGKKPVVQSIKTIPYNDYVYDLCGCENEAFFGGEKPVLLHNSRVRDLFKKAKQSAPAIVFVDELDAVGRHRGAGLGGGHDEREQTLNQILTEMDGFATDEGVIVMAATNRPDVLDPALLRPGRFDRHVTMEMPDIEERTAILNLHAKGKPLAEDVNMRRVAERTPGFSGADLANLVNEAAILTVRKRKKEIGMQELLDSVERVLLGPERKSHILSQKEKAIAAYHEAGHAIVAHNLPHMDPIRKISIVSRGRVGGYTLKLPEVEKRMRSRAEFYGELSTLLGGYTAELLKFKELTTGASNDLKEATKLARKIVTQYGMSSLGPMTYGGSEEHVFLGRELGERRNYSEETAHTIDEEVKRLLSEARKRAEDVLKSQNEKWEKVAQTLIEKETIEQDEFREIIGEKQPQEIEDKNKGKKEVQKPEEQNPPAASDKKPASGEEPKTAPAGV